MNINELSQRDPKDLKKLALQYGIHVDLRKVDAAAIARMIVDVIQNKPKELKHPTQEPKEAAVCNTEEEIRAAIKPYTDKGLEAIFPGDNTWWFKYKGAEEAGHMSVALRRIKTAAQTVSRGAYVMRGLKDKQLNSTANSGLVRMV